MTRIRLKILAKQQIQGNIFRFFVCGMIIGAISIGVSLIPLIGTLAIFLFSPALMLGLVKLTLGLTRGEKIKISKLFGAFDQFLQAFLLSFLKKVFLFLWFLLLVIPGIVKALSYSMANFILAENPGMTGLEAISQSRRIMKGHKMELFELYVSFLLWFLLGMLTLGIAYIYIIPYIFTTLANFYQDIK